MRTGVYERIKIIVSSHHVSGKNVDLNLYPRGLKEMFIWAAILTAALCPIYVIIATV